MDTTIQNNSFESFVNCKVSEDLNKIKMKKIRDRGKALFYDLLLLP